MVLALSNALLHCVGDEEGCKDLQGEAPLVKCSLVAGITEAYVKVVYAAGLGRIQPKCCGDSKKREISFDLFFTAWILLVVLLVPHREVQTQTRAIHRFSLGRVVEV